MAGRVRTEIVILLAFSVNIHRGQHNFAHHTALSEEHLTRGARGITLYARIMNQMLGAFLVNLHWRNWQLLAIAQLWAVTNGPTLLVQLLS